jgi:hypothetical protein
VYCHGVKNVVGPLVMSARQCEEFTGQFFGAYPEPPLAATLELAQDLVCGAVEYARSLGFEPAAEFHDVKGHLGGERTERHQIRARRKPFFVEGPYDNGHHIVRQLETLCRSGPLRIHGLRVGGVTTVPTPVNPGP